VVDSLEKYFGVAYPYDKLDLIAVPDFGSGAMENAGAITFREDLLLLDENAGTDERRESVRTLTHEISHQWFGDLVTMPWWDDLWLAEAFANWMQDRIVLRPEDAKRAEIDAQAEALHAMAEDSLASARQIRQPIAETNDMHSAFDDITYGKGSGVLLMFEHFLGRDVFQNGIRHHLEKFKLGNATADDFLRSISDAAGKDVAAPFHTFLDQPGVPLLSVKVHCDGKSKGEAELVQSRYLPAGSTGEAKKTWKIPVCIRYPVDEEATKMSCTLLESAEGKLALDSCPKWLLPNADGAGYYRFALEPEALKKLDAANNHHLSTREKLAASDSIQAGFAAGRVTLADALSALDGFTQAREPELASAPMPLLRFTREHLVQPAQLAKFEAYAKKLYKNSYAASGGARGLEAVKKAESDNARMYRREVVTFLADVVRDPAVLKDLKRVGRAYVQGGTVHADAANPDLAPVALGVAAEQGDAAFLEGLGAILKKSDDPVTRRQIVGAIGRVSEPATVEKARAMLLDEHLLKADEIFKLLESHLAKPENRASAEPWLLEHFDALAARVPAEQTGNLIRLLRPLCSAESAQRIEAAMGPKIQKLLGGPRSLAESVESIRLCAAEAAAHAEEAKSFFH
jgi:alanyl aminopeptidase